LRERERERERERGRERGIKEFIHTFVESSKYTTDRPYANKLETQARGDVSVL
jgi:hypothetical protein